MNPEHRHAPVTSTTPTHPLDVALGVALPDDLRDLALTHRSYAYENGEIPTNERLEFLGDSVLGLVVTDYLFRTYAQEPESQLARYRSGVVSQPALAAIAQEDLSLGSYIRLGRGEIATGGAEKASILSDTLEAVLGALFLAHGLDTARAVIERLCSPRIALTASQGVGWDWKSSLQELCAEHQLGIPQYVVSGEGPDHERVFTAYVVLGEQEFDPGQGRTKKAAEQIAAEQAYEALKREIPTDAGAS